MATGVQRPAPPPQQQYNNDGKKGKDRSGIGSLAGAVVGTAAGAFAGQPMAGFQAGTTAGGLIGQAVSTKGKDPSVGYAPQGPQPVEKTENSISRRLQSQQGDSLMSLAEGLQAVGRAAPEIRQEYAPPLFQAYMSEYERRNKGLV